jgi:hypothetical protein
MQADTAEKPADSVPEGGQKLRLLSVRSLDHRTKSARRAAALAVALTEELGGNLSIREQAAVQRAAVLSAIAEDARSRALGGEADAPSLEDLVRIDNAAARALKVLGTRTAIPKTKVPDLEGYLAAQQSKEGVEGP